MSSIVTNREQLNNQLLEAYKKLDIKRVREILEANFPDTFADPDQQELADYFKEHIKRKKLNQRAVLDQAQIPLAYGYKIFSGEKNVKNRDVILRLGIATGMKIDEINYALRLGGQPALSYHDVRDTIIIAAVQSRMKISDLIQWLEDLGILPPFVEHKV